MTKNNTKSGNDQRSTVKNPNNSQHAKAQGNRGKQLNPNGGSRKGGKR